MVRGGLALHDEVHLARGERRQRQQTMLDVSACGRDYRVTSFKAPYLQRVVQLLGPAFGLDIAVVDDGEIEDF